MKRIMLLVALVFWLAGCSTIPTMKGGYSSEVDPEFKFSKNLSIAVLPSKKGNVLKNKSTGNYINERWLHKRLYKW